MAARPSWSGAIDLGGFPVNVRFYNRISSKRREGFRMITPKGEPIHQEYRNASDKKFEYGELGRGYEVSPGQIVPLTQEALDQIGQADRTDLAEPAKFTPLASLDLTLNAGTYRVVADEKVAGADNSYKVLWNGLRAMKLAYVTKIVMRANSTDHLVAVYADPNEKALIAVALPYPDQVADLPEVKVAKDAKAEKVFKAFVEASYQELIGPFDRSEFSSEADDRRKAAIATILDGKSIEVPETKTPTAETPDLMAALEGALAADQATKKPARKRPAKTSKAKVKV